MFNFGDKITLIGTEYIFISLYKKNSDSGIDSLLCYKDRGFILLSVNKLIKKTTENIKFSQNFKTFCDFVVNVRFDVQISYGDGTIPLLFYNLDILSFMSINELYDVYLENENENVKITYFDIKQILTSIDLDGVIILNMYLL